MKLATIFAALCASVIPGLAAAQHAPIDYSQHTPIDGRWSYVRTASGSSASFLDRAGASQLTLICNRNARRITIVRPSSVAAPFLEVWTSYETQALPASFNPATNALTAERLASESLFDSMAASRGRIAVKFATGTALVVANWPDMVRVIEDCRS